MAKHKKPTPIIETVKEIVTLPFTLVVFGISVLASN